MTGPLVLPLVDCHESELVGGKAINLARMIRAGFGVPRGFVVTTEAFRAADGGEMPREVSEAVLHAYRRMGSPAVAVRSSATAEDLAGASMAGQYETFLDVRGDAAVLDAVRRCWSSIRAERVQTYLREHDIDASLVAMAVVVQELIPADVAGVLFTANPRTGSRTEMLIEASWGLGEAVVSGIVQPDTLIVDRATGAVKESVISAKRVWVNPETRKQEAVPDERQTLPCLTSHDVRELWTLGLRVMEYFGSAQDLEWAIHNGRLYLLQSRPVTTLEDAEAYETLLQDTRAQLRAWKREGLGDWVRHNLSETLPHPTPLTWSVIRRFMSGDGGFGAMYREVGFEPAPSVCRDGFLSLIGGRVYMDLAQSPEMFFEDFPFRYDVGLLLNNPDAAQGPPTIPVGGVGRRLGVGRKLKHVNANLDKLSENFDDTLDREVIPEFVEYVRAEKARDLRRLTTAEWVGLWRERERRVMDEFAPKSLLPGLITGMAMQRLRDFVEVHFWEEAPDELVNLLSVGREPDQTIRASDAMYELARGSRSVDSWLEEHGHRAPEEFDLATPRWRERADALESMAGHLKDGERPITMHERRAEQANAKVEQLMQRLSPGARREFRGHLDLLHRYIRFREDGKYYLMMGYELLRDLAREAARRLDVGEDAFLLTLEELQDALRTGFAPLHLMEQRRLVRGAEARLTVPNVVTQETIAHLGEPQKLDASKGRSALPISSGVCAGPARIVHSPDEAGELGRDYVLVCPSTDPSWTPLFVNAAGLVMECGGSLSHGAVVAREMGIPAVVVEGATRMFKDGETITVDGQNGAVFRGEAAPAEESGEPAEQADPEDVRIPRELVPPPAGPREGLCGRVRNIFLLIWGAYFVWVFLLPGTWLYDKTMAVLDAVLWPPVVWLGRPGMVAAIAAVFGTFTMIVQRLLTDNRRLLVAKKRAGLLRKRAMKLPPDSPRRAAMLKMAGPVQMRVLGAAMLPLALILGPLIMSFLWLPARVDPASRSPRPGWDMVVTARVDREHVRHVTVRPGEGLGVMRDATHEIPPIRQILEEEFLPNYMKRPDVSDVPVGLQTAEVFFRERSRQSLLQYLQSDITPGVFDWAVSTPEAGGRFRVAVTASGVRKGKPVEHTLGVDLVTGDELPPLPMEVVTERVEDEGKVLEVPKLAWVARADSPDALIEEIRVVPVPERVEETRGVFYPFGWLDSIWPGVLPGWLIIYIVIYVVAMVGLKFALRVA